MSLRLRLTLWYSGLLAGALLVFGVAFYFFTYLNTYNDLKDTVKSQAQQLGVTGTYVFNELDLNLDRESRIQGKNTYVQLINYSTGSIRQNSNLLKQDFIIPYPSASTYPQTGFVDVTVHLDNTKYRMITYQQPIIDRQINLVGLLQVGVIPYNEELFLKGLRNTLLFSAILVIMIAFTVGMFIARQALRPIEKVIDATKQIENGADLSMRISGPPANDEIGTLVNTLNLMLSRLERAYNELDDAYKAQRRFVSDASHELRTPLTTIRGNIDLLEKMWKQTQIQASSTSGQLNDVVMDASHFEMSHEAMSDISAEAKRMSTLVNDLLALARADAGYVMEKEKIDIYALTEAVVRRAQLLPRKVEWNVESLDVLRNRYVYGSEDYLQQLLFVFIENAFKYTSEGEVRFSVMIRDEHLAWVISDTGIGMNPDQVPYIFDRFYRADESRGVTAGTGLGLAIAKWIIEEHQGYVEVATLEGKGTTFTIWIPIDFS